MDKKDLIAHSPVRYFDATNAALKAGEMGLITAKKGLGKTSVLVQFGIDSLLNDKALVHVLAGNWDNARKEIKKIDSDISDAIEWWSQEQVVGRTEKDTVLLLLLLENKIDRSIKEIDTEEFWQEIEDNVSIPDEMKNEIKDIQQRYMRPR